MIIGEYRGINLRMGRKRSKYICPKCGKTGSFEQKPTSYDSAKKPRQAYRYVRHYENGKRTTCYIEDILRKQEGEEFLKEISISDEDFNQIRNSTNDTIPFLTKYNLTFEQLKKLSPTEQAEYLDGREKNILGKNERIENDKLRKFSGIKTKEQSEKISTTLPPKEYWGESNTRSYLLQVSRELEIVSKYLSKPPWQDPVVRDCQIRVSKQFKKLSEHMNKMAKLAYYFRPSTPDIDDKMHESYNNWYEKGIKPMYMILEAIGLQLGLRTKGADKSPKQPNNLNSERYKISEKPVDLKYQFELIIDIIIAAVTQIKYVTDERYSNTFTNWLNIAEDRYTQGIHASAALNPTLTNKTIMRLKVLNQDKIDEAVNQAKQPPKPKLAVLKIAVKRELTAKQVKNYTAPKGPLFRDLISVLKGQKAAMQLGLIKENKQINDLLLNATFLNLSF